MTDHELTARLRSGDMAASAELFERYWRAARAAAYGVTGEWASAEDAASDGFRRAFAGIGRLDDPARFGAWLRTIVVRTARASVRRRPRDPLPEQLPAPDESIDRTIERAQLAALIQQAMRRLPEPLRETMALHYYEGYDPPDAARLLGIPPGTFRRRLHDGRERIRAHIHDGSKQMDNLLTNRIEQIESMVATGEAFRATREALGIRLMPDALAAAFRHGAARAGVPDLARAILHAGSQEPPVVRAVRSALPQGASARLTKGLVRGGEGIEEVVRASPDTAAFQAAMADVRMVDVLELAWPDGGPSDLRAVQEQVERLASAVAPGACAAFSNYTLPRYRAAFVMRFGDAGGRAAVGGVVASTGAAEVRLYLDAWEQARSGQSADAVRRPTAQP